MDGSRSIHFIRVMWPAQQLPLRTLKSGGDTPGSSMPEAATKLLLARPVVESVTIWVRMGLPAWSVDPSDRSNELAVRLDTRPAIVKRYVLLAASVTASLADFPWMRTAVTVL